MPQPIFQFSNNADLSNWYSVDDVVMGGKSAGNLSITEEGFGCFSGEISKENNGGFSSVHYREKIKCSVEENIILRAKGDGKKYQLRIKQKAEDQHGYIYNFETSEEWKNYTIPLAEMKPYYRGHPLPIPNFDAEEFAEIALFLISEEAVSFNLLIDTLNLETP